MKKIKTIVIIFLILLAAFFITRFFDKKRPTKQSNYNAPGTQFGLTGIYNDEEYNLAAETGAQWIRPEFVWDKILKKDKTIDFEKLDLLYEQSQKYNFKILVSLRSGHDKDLTSCDLKLCEGKTCPNDYASCPPKDYDQYRDFVSQLAIHFKGKVDNFIIENEVNSLTFWNGTPEDYLKLRKTAYDAIHASNPTAVVFDSGIASEAWVKIIVQEKFCREGKDQAAVFIKQAIARRYKDVDLATSEAMKKLSCDNGQPVLDRGSQFIEAVFSQPESFDVANYHFYEPWPIQSEVISWIKNKMNTLGYSKPIWNTESGYFDSVNTLADKKTENLVAEDLIKLHAAAFGEDIKTFIWLPGVQRDKPYRGIYNQSHKLLPAGLAYENLINEIGGFTNVKKYNLGKENLFSYEFSGKEKAVVIMWSTVPIEMDLKLLPFPVSKIKNYLGAPQILRDKISIDDSPIYLEP